MAASRRLADVLKPQQFISALVGDPKRPPKVRAIRGFVGESDEQGCVRIYLDAELRRFIEVPTKGIEHAERVPTETSALGGVVIWVRQDLSIIHHGHWAGSEDPTTMATGEEGGDDPTTMATGEEAGGFEDPLDAVVNPFGRY